MGPSDCVKTSCDGWYDARIQVVPGQIFEAGAMTPINKNICNVTRPNKELVLVGETPQVEKTYTYYHVGYPFMYTDCMPGIVKSFIDSLKSLCGKQNNPSIGFLVQSGFPEAYHSRFVERYLEKLAKRLNCQYIGCIVKGGIEGTRVMPHFMTKKIFNSFYELGKAYGRSGKFDQMLLNKLAKPEHLSALTRLFYSFGKLIGLVNNYWDKQLKENNAFEKRFDKPYMR